MADTLTVSPTCEHILVFGDEVFAVETQFCGEPTAFWYPASGYPGDVTMALCKTHAIPLLPAHFGLREFASLLSSAEPE